MQILLIGNFNEENTKLVNGQTLKSDLIYKTLTEIREYEVKKINTNILKEDIFKLLPLLRKSNKIIVMLGQNGMKYLFPILYILTKIFKKELYYIVIGGWLPNYLKKNILLKKLLKHIKKILIESDGLKQELQTIGIMNTEILYNFRDEDSFLIEKNTNSGDNKKYFKTVFLSRVIKEKGIYDLIEVIKELNKIKKNINLDIYGPVEEKEKLMIKLDENIKYKGILEQKDIYLTLSKYDLMVFPTYYEGEGQAGVIIEAILSKLPVLASDWRFNTEFIKDNETGFLYKTKNNIELRKKIEYLMKNKKDLERIKVNLVKEREKFTKENFIKKIKKVLTE